MSAGHRLGGSRAPGLLRSQLCLLLVVLNFPRRGCLAALSLSSALCGMGMNSSSCLVGLERRLNEKMHVNTCDT